jgi:hypothetical protein
MTAKTSRRVGTLAALLALAAVPAPAHAAVRDCPQVTDERSGLAALATVLNVRDMSCDAARRAIHRYGSSVGGGVQFRKGGRFRLGAFRCTVYYVNYEAHRARCVSGGRAFRFDYGS